MCIVKPLILFISFLLSESSLSKKSLISDAFDDIEKINLLQLQEHKYKQNGVYSICTGLHGEFLLGCCKPNNVKIMENVMIKNGEFHVHNGIGKMLNTSNDRPRTVSLPPITNSYYRQLSTFTMKVHVHNQGLFTKNCTSLFNGTLHVSSRGSIHNLFHAVNDNILPLFAQIVTDRVVWPEFARLPRMNLVGFHIPSHHLSARRGAEPSLPHLQIFDAIFDGGTLALKDANGMCFRRVVWGTGLRMHYVDAMVVLRRLTADFARAFVLRAYNPPIPRPFTTTVSRVGSLVVDGRPINVLLISRGNTGVGRSMKNEVLIMSKLAAAGASVTRLGNGGSNFTEQMSLVLHAEVIVGLHGAGLVHGVFAPRGCIVVELKTQYGYQSDIFLRTSDSRQGTHVHIDVRNYSTPGEIHRIDEILANRVLKSILIAIKLQKEGHRGQVTKISRIYDDYVIGPSRSDGALANFLGPPATMAHRVCESQLPYWKFRDRVLKGNKLEYCDTCALPV